MRFALMIAVPAALVLGSLSLSALASENLASPPDAAVARTAVVDPKEGKPEERIICRTEKPIGSRRAERVCRTAASIEEEREDTLDALRHRSGTPRLDI